MTPRRFSVTLVGGPADGKSYTYTFPLPETLVIQGQFDNHFVVCDYHRHLDTLTYHANGHPHED